MGKDLVWEFRRSGTLRITDAKGGHFVESPASWAGRETRPRIDISEGDGAKKGIYRAEGDRLLVCVGASATAPRPTTFTDRPGQHLYLLKRAK